MHSFAHHQRVARSAVVSSRHTPHCVVSGRPTSSSHHAVQQRLERSSSSSRNVTVAAAGWAVPPHHHDKQQQPGSDWAADLQSLGLLKQRRQQQQQQQQQDGAADSGTHASGPGKVFLVGTGPGDPGLLTLRAVQLMQSADVVLYDRLVSDDILQLVHGEARMVYVGKQAGYHTRTQPEIHELLLQFAEAGATVVRLKGGDPYVFGRGGEEVQYLQQQGIPVQCVPGVTAAAGICAELGIPMTHRGVATSVRFLTGHAREGGQAMLDDTIRAAADPNTTLVVYMGLSMLPLLVQQLQQHGMPQDVPAVAVERGTTAQQRVVFGTLAELHDSIQAAKLQSPTLLIIGQVVALSPGWEQWQQEAQAAGAGAVEMAAARADLRHDCARLQLPDAVATVLQQQQQQQQQQQMQPGFAGVGELSKL